MTIIELANEKTKDMPNPNDWYIHWNFKSINETEWHEPMIEE